MTIEEDDEDIDNVQGLDEDAQCCQEGRVGLRVNGRAYVYG